MIVELYLNRWQIDFFFKWLKQHLKIQVMGLVLERRVDPYLLCHDRLLYDRNCPEEEGNRQAYQWDVAVRKCFIYRV